MRSSSSTRLAPPSPARLLPAPRRPYLRYTLLAALAALVIAVAVLQFRYGLLLAAPRAPRLFAGSGIFFVVDSSHAGPLAPELLGQQLPGIPRWLSRYLLPYEAGGATRVDMDENRVALNLYLSTRRGTPMLARSLSAIDVRREAPEIRWSGRVQRITRGLLRLNGTVPFEREAEKSYGYMWDQSTPLAPLMPRGGHLVEAVFDNRRGHAYLIAASVLAAYNINLDEDENEASMASLQFVREARIAIDFAPPDALKMRITIDIMPNEIDKLGVVNLKVGIEEGFTLLSERWNDDFDLELSGDGRWEGSSIAFDYRLKGARKALNLLLEQKLF